MKKKSLYLVLLILLSITLSACTNNTDQDLKDELEAKDNVITSLENEKKELVDRITQLESNAGVSEDNLIIKAIGIMEMVKEKDLEGLASNVHPAKGVRFSAYEYIDVDNDRVLSASEIAELATDTNVYTWGSFDGIGDPINLNFNDYYDRFIYNNEFINPQVIGNNTSIGTGNTINNMSEAYPDGQFIEFHFKGFDPQYEGMDWNSLKLVFEQYDGEWYLVGIVHGEWTI